MRVSGCFAFWWNDTKSKCLATMDVRPICWNGYSCNVIRLVGMFKRIRRMINFRKINYRILASAIFFIIVVILLSVWAFPQWRASIILIIVVTVKAIKDTFQVIADYRTAVSVGDIDYLANRWEKPRDANGVLYVVGTGEKTLTSSEVWMSSTIGKSLAQNSYVLITGGWPGVDHVVAEAFSQELKKLPEKPLAKYLLHILGKERTLDFKRGGTLSNDANSDFEATGIRLNISDALIAIGGKGGVAEISERALLDSIPVFPIARTNGDAQKVFGDIVNDWNQSAMKKVSKTDFERILNQQIDSKADAIALTNELMQLVKKSA